MGKESLIITFHKSDPSILWINNVEFTDAEYIVKDGIFHMTGLRVFEEWRDDDITNQEELDKIEPKYILTRTRLSLHFKRYTQHYVPKYRWFRYKEKKLESITSNIWIIRELSYD